MTFEELEHTADVRMKISADSFSGLLAEAGFALSRILYGEYRRETPVETFSIHTEGKNPEEVIVNFLSELLYLTEVAYLVPQDISAGDDTVVIAGVPFDPGKHAGGTCVKGISYSGLSLTGTAAGYELIIIFDI
jgi:SHS2 domain-containing protein